MQPFKYELNDGFTSFHGAHMHDAICATNIIVGQDMQILLLICKMKGFILAPEVTSYFVHRIVLEIYVSYRYSSLRMFNVLPARNLAVQSLCGRFGTPCIFKAPITIIQKNLENNTFITLLVLELKTWLTNHVYI